MNMKRFIKTGITTLFLVLFMSFTAFAGEWQQDTAGWWYSEDDGTYPVNQWKEIDGKHYYFNENGYMLSDTTTPDGYKVGPDGAWVQELTEDNKYDVAKSKAVKTIKEMIDDIQSMMKESF